MRKLTVRVTDGTMIFLKRLAELERRSMAKQIEVIVHEAMKRKADELDTIRKLEEN